MASVEKSVRRIVTLPPQTVKRVQALAQAQHTSSSRVLIDLIESGLETRQFSDLIDKLASTPNPNKRKEIKDELARLTFGE